MKEIELLQYVLLIVGGGFMHPLTPMMATSFQIKSFIPKHICTWRKHSTQPTSKFLANNYMETLRDEPKWKPSSMKKAVLRDFDLNVSKYKVKRAKKKAKLHIEGDHGLQFARARDYCQLIQSTNPGSIAVTTVNIPTLDDPARFEGLFVCFEAMKKGFLEGCRSFIGLDGCFLKGPYKGQMLIAIGKDGDNGIFPIAIAVVRAETKQFWKWFLEQLQSALGPLNRFTFMSDRQKGLVECFEDILHGTEHRYCVKHMYDNFKKTHKGSMLRAEMWNAAKVLTEDKFNYHMEIIKKISKDAYEWFVKVPARLWSRSKFNDMSKCDLLVNNFCEKRNDNIGEARDKPLITCLEWIRGYLMYRNQSKREWIQKQEGLLCPTIALKLKTLMDDARHCSVKQAAPEIYEVSYKGVNDGVNLGTRQCSCRAWDLIGIPCIHAIACIISERGNPKTWVDTCYHRETYIRTYSPITFPMPLRHMTREVGTAPIHPPIVKPTTSRPKKARKKAIDEANKKTGQVSKQRQHFKCGKCGDKGHNSKTCKASEEELARLHTKVRRSVGGRPKQAIASGLPGGLPDIGGVDISRQETECVSGVAVRGTTRGRGTAKGAIGNTKQLQKVINVPSRYESLLNTLSQSSSVDLNVLWSTQASTSSGCDFVGIDVSY